MQLIPQVSDEVLVGFEHDDKRRPVVLGGLWNANDPTPKARVSGGAVETLVWKSTKGHQFEFDDGDPPSITLSHGRASSSLHLEKDASKLQADQQLSIQANSIEITADTTLKLKARSIEISADADVSVKGTVIKLN